MSGAVGVESEVESPAHGLVDGVFGGEESAAAFAGHEKPADGFDVGGDVGGLIEIESADDLGCFQHLAGDLEVGVFGVGAIHGDSRLIVGLSMFCRWAANVGILSRREIGDQRAGVRVWA